MRNKKNLIILLIMFLFTLLIFNGFITMHYSTDTYNIIDRGYKEYAIKYSLNDGRPFMCLISLVAEYINIPITGYIIILTGLAIFVSCISTLILKNIIEKYKKPSNIYSEIILTIICYFTIFNFMFLENLQFAECFVMAVSILLYLLSANYLVNNKYLKSIIFIILGILFYQGTIGFSVVMVVIITILRKEKHIIKNIIIIGLFCVISVIINLIQIKICGQILNMTQIRMGSINNISTNIIYILKRLPYILIYTVNLFPEYILIVYVMTIIIAVILSQSNKVIVPYIIIIILISIGSAFAPNLFTLAGFRNR